MARGRGDLEWVVEEGDDKYQLQPENQLQLQVLYLFFYSFHEIVAEHDL